jgi:transcriptional regulator with XRE-family HTH domain
MVGSATGSNWADRVRRARKDAGITQAELARRLGKSQAFVSQAESGATRIGPRYVDAVLRACGWTGERDVLTQSESPMSEEISRSHEASDDSWDALRARYAGLDPETFDPVLRGSARDMELREKYAFWTGEPSIWDLAPLRAGIRRAADIT